VIPAKGSISLCKDAKNRGDYQIKTLIIMRTTKQTLFLIFYGGQQGMGYVCTRLLVFDYLWISAE